MSDRIRVLMVEDNPGDADLVVERLPKDGPAGFEVSCVPRLAMAFERLTADRPDILLVDLGLPDSTGLDTVRAVRDAAPHLPLVVITGNGDEEMGMAAMKEGAQDYVVKGTVSDALLPRVLRYAVERNRNARRLRESEERELEVLEHGGVGVTYWDLAGRLLLMNRRAIYDLGGSDLREFLGRSLAEIVGDEAGRQYLERIREAAVSPVSREYEFYADMPIGPRWYSSVFTRSLDAAGNVVGVHAYAYDITERKLMEKSLRLTKFSVDNADDFVYWLGPEGLLEDVSVALCRSLGYAREELLTMSIFDLDPTLTRKDYSIHWDESKDLGSCTFESEHLTKDGVIIPVESTMNYLEFDGEEFVCTFTRDITRRQLAAEELREGAARLARLVQGTVQALSSLAEQRDPYTAGHQQRVAALCCAVGAQMGFAPEDLEGLRTAALLHDIGKVAVPIEILSKPGALSPHEMEIVRTHPEVAYQILKDIEFPWPVAQIIRQHHERMDGSGYPWGIADENILLEARILAVADVVEAISSHRPYRAALGLETALAEVSASRGLYDGRVVRACATVLEDPGILLEGRLAEWALSR